LGLPSGRLPSGFHTKALCHSYLTAQNFKKIIKAIKIIDKFRAKFKKDT
jgi:hypothetical protein